MTFDYENLSSYEPIVRKLARDLLEDDDRVDDVVQETWLQLLQRPPESRKVTVGWLVKVARNFALQSLRGDRRRARRETRAARAETVAAPRPGIDEAALSRSISEVLRNLSETHREIVVLRFFEGLPPRSVAKRLGIPVETVRTRTRRALAMVRAGLDERHGPRLDWRAGIALFLFPKPVSRPPLLGRLARRLFHFGTRKMALASLAVLIAGVTVTLSLVDPWHAAASAQVPGATPADPGGLGLAADARSARESETVEVAETSGPRRRRNPRSGIRRGPSGRIVDEAGNGVAGAIVYASPTTEMAELELRTWAARGAPESVFTTRSAPDGNFEFEDWSGASRVLLLARSADLAGWSPLLQSAEWDGTSVVVRKTGSIRGSVLTSTGAPAIVVLRAYRIDLDPLHEVARAQSDADGRFRLDGLLPGRFVVRTRAAGTTSAAVGVELTAAGTEIRVPAEAPAHVIEGRILGADGKSISHVRMPSDPAIEIDPVRDLELRRCDGPPSAMRSFEELEARSSLCWWERDTGVFTSAESDRNAKAWFAVVGAGHVLAERELHVGQDDTDLVVDLRRFGGVRLEIFEAGTSEKLSNGRLRWQPEGALLPLLCRFHPLFEHGPPLLPGVYTLTVGCAGFRSVVLPTVLIRDDEVTGPFKVFLERE